MPYERLIKLPIEYVLCQVKPRIRGQKPPAKVRIGDEFVNCTSVRLQTFKNSTICVGCGVKGEFFWLERNGNPQYHLNMYGIRENGGEVLMTKDHIIPRSKGGKDGLANMQTMCTHCNCKKGNKMP